MPNYYVVARPTTKPLTFTEESTAADGSTVEVERPYERRYSFVAENKKAAEAFVVQREQEQQAQREQQGVDGKANPSERLFDDLTFQDA